MKYRELLLGMSGNLETYAIALKDVVSAARTLGDHTLALSRYIQTAKIDLGDEGLAKLRAAIHQATTSYKAALTKAMSIEISLDNLSSAIDSIEVAWAILSNAKKSNKKEEEEEEDEEEEDEEEGEEEVPQQVVESYDSIFD